MTPEDIAHHLAVTIRSIAESEAQMWPEKRPHWPCGEDGEEKELEQMILRAITGGPEWDKDD